MNDLLNLPAAQRNLLGPNDSALLARIRELAKADRNWSESLELSRLRAKADVRGLAHA